MCGDDYFSQVPRISRSAAPKDVATAIQPGELRV
jgi:hypothetical protein